MVTIHHTPRVESSYGLEVYPITESCKRTSKATAAIEFDNEDTAYSIWIEGAGDSYFELVTARLQSAHDRLHFAVRANTTLMSYAVSLGWPKAILASLPDPAFLLSPAGTVLWNNSAALKPASAASYSLGQNQPLHFHNSATQNELRVALAKGPDGGVNYVRVDAGGDGSGLLILKSITPVPAFPAPWAGFFAPPPATVAVLREKGSTPAIPLSQLRALYGLTPKEAELAIALAKGESLRDYAERTGVSFETVRWHSKKVMEKMDCSKQQEIVCTLLYRNALFAILG